MYDLLRLKAVHLYFAQRIYFRILLTTCHEANEEQKTNQHAVDVLHSETNIHR